MTIAQRFALRIDRRDNNACYDKKSKRGVKTMSCGCGKSREKDAKRERVYELAKQYQRKHGGVVVFYRCADYDFTTLENFDEHGKTEIEYIL